MSRRNQAQAAVVAAGLLLSVGVTLARGDEVVTLLLKDGQRITGQLASYDPPTVDIRMPSGQRQAVPLADVVIMDFTGGARSLPAAEVSAAREAGQMMVTRDGKTVRGKVADFISEGGADATVVYESAQGRQQVRLDQVARIYVGTLTKEALSAVGAQAAASPPAGNANTLKVSVPAIKGWVATGFFVSQGETLTLVSEGTVYLRAGRQDEAGVTGAREERRAPAAPMPSVLVGALIGRVGPRGQAFGIGGQTSLTMPASGELFLAVNDDQWSDNDGEFSVTLTRSGSPARRRD